jgi:biofilm PGA synthesis N-glycosyltransferase PgaC
MRHGYGQYYMGTGLMFMLASVVSRLNQKPYVVGSLATLWGWMKAALGHEPRYEDVEFRKFLRNYQWRALLGGKKRALDAIQEQYDATSGGVS